MSIQDVRRLRKSIIFLHGLSGSGKGETARRLQEQYAKQGYIPIYAQSGALFRAAMDNPAIAEQVRTGKFADTLAPIAEGLQEILGHFIQSWTEQNGKAVLILDGLIRRGTYTNAQGKEIPSQIDQLAYILNNAIANLIDNPSIQKCFPGYADPDFELSDTQQVQQLLKDATHIVIDVKPEDAEAQMLHRAERELVSIQTQVNERSTRGGLNRTNTRFLERTTQKLNALLHGGIRQDRKQIRYLSPSEWPSSIPPEMYPALHSEIINVRTRLAQVAGFESTTPLSESFEKFGIATELREDDVSAQGRRKRVENYVRRTTREGKTRYTPGFATEVLIKDLGLRFSPSGSFTGTALNLVIIKNGRSRGVDFETFKSRCDIAARRCYNLTELEREKLFPGQEGRRSGKERI